MAFENLPGIFDFKVDGNLGQLPVNDNPIVLVIGTAGKGDSETLVAVNKVSEANKTFGKEGTLTRGLIENAGAGALNLRAMRIGATAARLESIGTGITLITARKDDSAGTDYTLFWDDTAKRLRVYRASDAELVYDNNPASPEDAVDLGEVYVSGVASGTPGDIGTLIAPITLLAADTISGASFTAGTDGLSLSRMGMWESLYKAYKLLEDADLDFIVPMNVYLDDRNLQDMTTAQVTALQTLAPWLANNYPTAGDSFDVLGKVFAQEFNGNWLFWWDMDRDGIAEIFPTGSDAGAATATTDADGNALAAADFHEVNFAYDLARFCFDKSEDNDEIIGYVGTKGPASFSLADVASWVGKAPVASEDPSGNMVITTNGTGLLGNKFMAGRLGNIVSGLPSFSIDGIDGLLGGGFIAHEGEFLDDGAELKDANDKLVDLGKYISVVGAQYVLSNSFQDVRYVASGAAAYAGFTSALAPNSAPTNKVLDGVRLPFRISLAKLDLLAGSKYVMSQTKPKGIVISDSPTAARAESDYRRLSTVRIVKATLDSIRAVADPFLGEAITGARLAALETAIDGALSKLQKGGFLQRYEHKVLSTPSEQVLGKATVELLLVPAFELRQITVIVNLAAQ